MENIMDRVFYEKVGRVGIISLNMVGDNNRCDIHSYPAINEALLQEMKKDENVVDADFEEVKEENKEEDKEKSA